MANKKTARRALFTSVISLILCCCMLVGTTFAWFTDSVTSANNIIKSGNLDIELEYAVFNDDGTFKEWKDVKDQDDILTNNLWEPGVTEVAYFRLANAGSLALKYQFGINIQSEKAGVNQAGETFNLSDHIKFGVVEGVNVEAGAYADRDAAIAAVEATAQVLNAGYTKPGTLYPANNIPADVQGATSDLYLALVVYMPTTVDNVANHKTSEDAADPDKYRPEINLGINVLATQETYEKDSFNELYDENAWVDGFDVYTEDDLKAALDNSEPAIDVMADIELTEPIVIPAAQTTYSLRTNATIINLNGKTISAAWHKNVGPVIKNEGNLVLKNGTVSSTGNNGGSAIGNNGTAVLENVTLNGAPNADGSWPSYTVNNTGKLTATNAKFTSYHGSVASYGDGAQVTLNNCEIDMAGIPGFTNHGIYTYDNGEVVVNGGIYTNNAADQNATGASVINGDVTVNAGTFNGRIENYYGTPVIKGGTFSVKPNAKFIAAGYEVTDNGDGTWTVGAHKVSSGTELADAIANGKAVELTQDINLGKIDLTGTINNDVVINANGHKITTTDSYGIEVTAGKNVTISNADVEMTKEGDYITYAAGFKIANGDYADATIKLENCTITMANTDWAYAVNMPASVKNLNLVIDNCTLEGAVAVQCWGDNNTITITNSKLICNYTTSAQYTSYCVALQSDGTNVAQNNTLKIDNCEFQYSGIDNFNSPIYAATDLGTGNAVTVTNCTYGEKVVAE